MWICPTYDTLDGMTKPELAMEIIACQEHIVALTDAYQESLKAVGRAEAALKKAKDLLGMDLRMLDDAKQDLRELTTQYRKR